MLKELSIEKATHKNIQIIREIRNSCRFYMTNNNNIITEEEQTFWFNNLNENENFVLLFRKKEIPVGYGIIKINEDSAILTGGLLEEFRGQGLGKELFSILIAIAKNKKNNIKLDVLISNEIAKSLYKSLGFIEINNDGRVIEMELMK